MEPTPFADVAGWLPAWIGTLGAAVWVNDPHGTVVFMNPRAEALLGRAAERAVGEPCHRVIHGTNTAGVPICRSFCAVRMLAANHATVEPVSMRVPGAGGRWIEVMVIPLSAPDKSFPWLVHCAVDVERAHRLEAYISRVAHRSGDEAAPGGIENLSAREKEVLQLLARDLDTHSIARELFLSHATVRNHVQHLLEKLDAHSIDEAVARYLLSRAS